MMMANDAPPARADNRAQPEPETQRQSANAIMPNFPRRHRLGGLTSRGLNHRNTCADCSRRASTRHLAHVASAILKSGVPLGPVENDRVGFLRRLPEKSMGLAFENLHFRAGNAFDQYFRLRDVIAADRVGFPDQYEGRRFDVAQAVRAFEVMARDAEVNKFRQLGVRRPGQLEELFNLITITVAIVFGKKSI